MADIVESVETVKSKGYRARQQTTFEFLGTTSAMWKACAVKAIMPIVGSKQDGQPIFDIPVGYKVVNPFSEANGVAGGGCELCGHPIENFFPIKCDAKQIIMYVGSECVNNFMGAGFTSKQIRKFKEDKLRADFKVWVPKAVAELDGHTVTKTNSYGSKYGWLNEPYYSLRQTLRKDSAENLSKTWGSKKIKNCFKNARAMGLAIPDGIIEPVKPGEETLAMRPEVRPTVQASPRLSFSQMVAARLVKEVKVWQNDTWTVRSLV